MYIVYTNNSACLLYKNAFDSRLDAKNVVIDIVMIQGKSSIK